MEIQKKYIYVIIFMYTSIINFAITKDKNRYNKLREKTSFISASLPALFVDSSAT